MNRTRIGCTLALALALMAAPVSAQESGLHILLTNDDGIDAPALRLLASALVDAGHRVSIVAPGENRSGSSLSLTSNGSLAVERRSDAVVEAAWSVSGTPSDAVSVGLVYALREDRPDLVVSGPNFGQNVGANVLQSGTVGAALTAARAGVPAIALSVAVSHRESESDPPFPSTTGATEGASDLVVEIIRQLTETSAEGLLAPRTVLNVNYPAVGTGPPEGVRFATVSSVRAFRQLFAVNGAGTEARVQSVVGDVDQAEEGSDVALLEAGFATISLLGGSLDLGREAWEPLLRRLVIERVP